jgi:hypothetical protein
MVSEFNEDDWLSSELTFQPEASTLLLRLRAKKAVRVTELQGFVSDLDVFGASIPPGFRRMQFGEGVEIPEGMKADVEHMNRLQFRWGCDVSIAAGAGAEIRIPASGPGKDRAVITIAYEFPRLLGLLKGSQGLYARMQPNGAAACPM